MPPRRQRQRVKRSQAHEDTSHPPQALHSALTPSKSSLSSQRLPPSQPPPQPSHPTQPSGPVQSSEPSEPLQPSQTSPFKTQDPSDGIDWDLFATVLSRTARDHERRKRLTPTKASQPTPTRANQVLLAPQPSEGEGGDDLPRSDDSQFSTYTRTESESGSSDGEEGADEDDLPDSDDSQFETVRQQAVDDGWPSPTDSQFEETRGEHEDEDEDGLPDVTDSQFEETDRREELNSHAEVEEYPDAADSQFEQTVRVPLPGVNPGQQTVGGDELDDAGSQAEESSMEEDEDSLPDPRDSQFERTQDPRRGSGDSAEMAATEAALGSFSEAEGEGVMTAKYVEVDGRVEEVEEDERVEGAEEDERVEEVEEDAEMQPAPTQPAASIKPIPALSQVISSRVRRKRDDPTEFAPPDQEDLTEAERRAEVSDLPEPSGALHGPRQKRPTIITSQKINATASQKMVNHKTSHKVNVDVIEQAGPPEPANGGLDADEDLEILHEQANEMDTAFDPPHDDFYRPEPDLYEPPLDSDGDPHDDRRREVDPFIDEVVVDEPFRDDLAASPEPRFRPHDPYLVDDDGQPLGPKSEYVVPADWVPPTSRIHGKMDGKTYQYSRLDGRRVRFTEAESLLLWRTIQQVPMSVANPVDVAAYFYGEFGVYSKALAPYNKQHMRSRLVTMCETRVNRGLLIEGRARMFLPPRHTARQEYEEDKKDFRDAEKERLAVKEEEEWGDRLEEVDESDRERDEDDEPPRKRSRVERARKQRIPERPMPVNRAYVEIPVRRLRQLNTARFLSRDGGDDVRPSPSLPDSDVDSDPGAVPRFYRRSAADFAHLPPFHVPEPPTSPVASQPIPQPTSPLTSLPPSRPVSPPASSSSSPEPPRHQSTRRQSAPARMRGIRPPPSHRAVFDEIVEQSEDESEDEIMDERAEREDEIMDERAEQPEADDGLLDSDEELPTDLESEEGNRRSLSPHVASTSPLTALGHSSPWARRASRANPRSSPAEPMYVRLATSQLSTPSRIRSPPARRVTLLQVTYKQRQRRRYSYRQPERGVAGDEGRDEGDDEGDEPDDGGGDDDEGDGPDDDVEDERGVEESEDGNRHSDRKPSQQATSVWSGRMRRREPFTVKREQAAPPSTGPEQRASTSQTRQSSQLPRPASPSQATTENEPARWPLKGKQRAAATDADNNEDPHDGEAQDGEGMGETLVAAQAVRREIIRQKVLRGEM
ncbi:hypothetical protein CspeluHIS016_0901060 [Cutaneotrichosporon spelunceum]|uniref:Uncharacterized protein n=1 Tax=Cutaneotrichosporon spelunceum TaxID=1672016 RepID=A0AAD3YFA5_9TREE|nr:hypothetical protein CspeluHIS016_0901060 [Cutaneotrichosporon spelunceum]